MKFSSILSPKYWIILPWIFFLSLVLFFLLSMIANPWRDVATDHVIVYVTNVHPTCVDVHALDPQRDAFEVNITCPELAQNPNRQSIEEDIAYDLFAKKYDFVFGGKAYLSEDGLRLQALNGYAYRVYRIFVPDLFTSWRMEKKIDDTLITLSGTIQTDTIYRLVAVIKSIMARDRVAHQSAEDVRPLEKKLKTYERDF